MARIAFHRFTLIAALAFPLSAAWLADRAWAQQSDKIGERLGTVPQGRPQDGTRNAGPGAAADSLRVPVVLRAGQSLTVRAGASSFTGSGQTAQLAFRLERKPACGTTWETPQGVVLEASAECAGQTLEFDYEVDAAGSQGGPQKTEKVLVRAAVQPGTESCGIPNAPFEFISIPGGTYSLQDAPPQIADLASLFGTKAVTVDPFCISEEAIPGSEVEAFLAALPLASKRKSFPEALEGSSQPPAQVETGRSVRAPALAVSYRMAKGYAERKSDTIRRAVRLPRLEHYVAAAIYLVRQQPDMASTHSFFVSLRGGQMEWTDAGCNPTGEKITVLGTRYHSGTLERYCYDGAQRVSTMGFRLIAATER